jgi:30S ribosomal protein S31
MGKGDKKSRRGKITIGSYGKTRPKNKVKSYSAGAGNPPAGNEDAAAEKKPAVKKVAETKKAAEKKPSKKKEG